MTKTLRTPKVSEVTRLHAQGMTPYRIACVLRADLETVEYILEREWLHWAAQYGYDN